jgi:hypothetical protein
MSGVPYLPRTDSFPIHSAPVTAVLAEKYFVSNPSVQNKSRNDAKVYPIPFILFEPHT